MEPKNLISENLFSKGELFLDNKAYTGPYNIKADGSYHTLSKFVENKSKKLTTKQESRYQKLLKITGGTDVSLKNKQVVGSVTLPKPDDYEKDFTQDILFSEKEQKILLKLMT